MPVTTIMIAVAVVGAGLSIGGQVTHTPALTYAGLGIGAVGGAVGGAMAFAAEGAGSLAGWAGTAIAVGNTMSIVGKATNNDALVKAGFGVTAVGGITGLAAASHVFDAATINTDVYEYQTGPPGTTTPLAANQGVAGQLTAQPTPGLDSSMFPKATVVPQTQTETPLTPLGYTPQGDAVSNIAWANPTGGPMPEPTPQPVPAGAPITSPGAPQAPQPPGVPGISPPMDPYGRINTDAVSKIAWANPTGGPMPVPTPAPGSSPWQVVSNLPDWAKVTGAMLGIQMLGGGLSGWYQSLNAAEQREVERILQEERNRIASRQVDITGRGSSSAPLMSFSGPSRPAGLINRPMVA